MTVSSDLNRAEYQGDGATKAFAYGFLVLQSGDLEAYLDGVRQVGGYTVSNIGVVSGGNVTFATAPAAGVNVTILRRTVADQTLNYVTGDKFPAEVAERALDKLTLIAQDVRDEISKSLRFPAFEQSAPAAELPTADDRKGRLLGFALADGAPIATDAEITGILVSSAMEAIVQAASLALARAALGVGGLGEANTWTQQQTLSSLIVSGAASVGGTLALPGVVTAPDLTADVDDFNPTGLDQAAVLRVRTDGNGVRTISGIAGGFAGRRLILLNHGSNNEDRIELLDSDVGSVAANRFQLDGRIYIGHSQSVVLWYDGDDSVWRVESRSWQTANDAQVEAAVGPEYMIRATNMHRHPGHPKAWINFDGTGVIAIRDSYNVMGVADGGTGAYTITFENGFADTNYALAGSWARAAGTGDADRRDVGASSNSAKSTTAMTIQVSQANGTGNQGDSPEIGLIWCGELAA